MAQERGRKEYLDKVHSFLLLRTLHPGELLFHSQPDILCQLVILGLDQTCT